MKKKISLLLCMLAAVLSMSGCSGQEKTETYDKETLKTTAEFIVESFSQMGEEDFSQFENVSEFQLDYTMMSTGLKIEGDAFLGIIHSWNAGVEECGAYVSHGDYTIEEKAKEVVLTTQAQYENRAATMVFTFDKSSSLKSLDISAKFTTGEILSKAGLNTLLGMGVVFAVLIFLAFIISLMKYIPMLLDGGMKKKMESKPKVASVKETVEKEEEVAAVIAAGMAASETDNLELIAVITAAIAMQEGTSPDGFVVRSIRRRPSNNW